MKYKKYKSEESRQKAISQFKSRGFNFFYFPKYSEVDGFVLGVDTYPEVTIVGTKYPVSPDVVVKIETGQFREKYGMAVNCDSDYHQLRVIQGKSDFEAQIRVFIIRGHLKITKNKWYSDHITQTL